jgi:hypothetical protein
MARSRVSVCVCSAMKESARIQVRRRLSEQLAVLSAAHTLCFISRSELDGQTFHLHLRSHADAVELLSHFLKSVFKLLFLSHSLN